MHSQGAEGYACQQGILGQRVTDSHKFKHNYSVLSYVKPRGPRMAIRE